MATARDICLSALRDLNIIGAVDDASPEDLAVALDKLNRLVDNWNADRQLIYASLTFIGVLIPNHAPHTIGPIGDFITPIRPVEIEDVTINIGSNVYLPVNLRDRQWWNAQLLPAQTSTYPNDLNYEPTWPNGTLNFWPVPTSAKSVELVVRLQVSEFALGDTFSMPQGYKDAIILTLCESLIPMFPGAAADPKLGLRAEQARARIVGNNVQVPRLRTADDGLGGGAAGGRFNYRTGLTTR